MTHQPVQDVAIGCFHPNARGIRPRDRPADGSLEDCRDVWLATRKRTHFNVSVLDHLLKEPGVLWKTPLGSRQHVTNMNVRVVYGESPPLETIFCPESELFERLSSPLPLSNGQQSCPPLLLLENFVFR
jgi:hypothetical protein